MVAIGGGMLKPRETTPLHVEYAIKLSGKATPRLCVLNQAVGDDPAYYLRFYDRLADSPAEVRHLSLFPMPNVADPEDFLLSQDIIFVGGGSVANMVAVWRVHGIDEILRKAWHAGIVLAGSSAGGICWFEGGTTDSFGAKLRPYTDGLGMLAGSFCPHYNSEDERRPLFRRLVADGTLPAGLACDDGVGAHYVDDSLAEMIADHPDGRAFHVIPGETGGSVETEIPVRFLGALRGSCFSRPRTGGPARAASSARKTGRPRGAWPGWGDRPRRPRGRVLGGAAEHYGSFLLTLPANGPFTAKQEKQKRARPFRMTSVNALLAEVGGAAQGPAQGRERDER